MIEMRFGDLVVELSNELARAAEHSERDPLRLDTVEVGVPTHIRVAAADRGDGEARLQVSLPSSREVPGANRLARVQLTLSRRPTHE